MDHALLLELGKRLFRYVPTGARGIEEGLQLGTFELTTEDRSNLGEALRIGLQAVETGAEQFLNGVWNPDRFNGTCDLGPVIADPEGALFQEGSSQLLDIEGIAFTSVEDALLQGRR